MHDMLKIDKENTRKLLEKVVNESLEYINSLDNSFVAPKFKID